MNSEEFNLTTFVQGLQFENRCLKGPGDDFQQLFEDIMVRTRPEFMQIRPYGNIGDRKCDGLLYGDGTIFQVYSPDELKQSQLKKKINEDLDGAVKHWGDTLKKWVFVYNVRGGLAPDIPKILQQKQKQYPNIEIDHWSNHELWKIACELSIQERAEILGVPIFEDLAPLGFKPEKNAVCQFLEDIENDERFKYIEFFHTPQEVVLKEQYIPIQVTLETKRKDVENFWQPTESEAELKRAYALKGMDDESQRSQVDWEEAKKQHNRIMVLADPGMGKSTLLKMEAVLTAKVEKQKLLENETTVDKVIFPIFLRLSDLVDEKIEKIFKAELIDAILMLIHRDYRGTLPEISHLIKEKLEAGKCLLLLDALDEVPREHRNRLKEKLNRFTRNYPCQVICTSRIVGYYDGACMDRATKVEILPFKQKQIEKYIEIWFTNAAVYIDNDLVSANGLIRELQNKLQVRGLAQNPLLLSLLCSLYQEKELTLPAQRCQIYEKAVDCILSKWTQNRKPQSEGKIRAKIRVLEELAYQFTCEGKEILAPDELYDKIEAYLQEEKITVFRDTNTDELMTELSEEDGIIQKLSSQDERYLFLHRAFQEYFTAKYIDNHRQIKKLVAQYLIDYRWQEVFLLVAGLMREGADELLLLMEKEAQKYIDTPKLKGLLRWADEATASSEGNFKAVAKRAVGIALALGSAYNFAFPIYRVDVLSIALVIDSADDVAVVIDNAEVLSIDDSIALANELRRFKIFNDVSFTLLISSLEALKAKFPGIYQPLEVPEALFQSLLKAWLEAFNLNPELINLSKEEAKAISNYSYAHWLIVNGKQAATEVSPETWEGIEERILKVSGD